MRRQTATSGINPAGSSRALRLDPLSLPVRFDAHDTRADGGVRQIELHRERVVLRRAVQRHADGGQRPRQRFSRRRAARHRRCPDAGAGASRSVIDDSAVRELRPRGNRRSLADVERHLRAAAIAGRQDARARAAAPASQRDPGNGVRNSWCGGAPAICSIRRTSIRASARSSRGIERTSSLPHVEERVRQRRLRWPARISNHLAHCRCIFETPPSAHGSAG